MYGPILIAQGEAAHWEHGMAISTWAVPAILAPVARGAAAARERRGAEAAVREAAALCAARAT